MKNNNDKKNLMLEFHILEFHQQFAGQMHAFFENPKVWVPLIKPPTSKNK